MSPSALPKRLKLWLGLVVTLLVCALPLFVALGDADAENDEAGYSFAVEEMIQNGDWLTPRAIPDETLPFLEKPPLKFWIVAAPIALGLLPQDDFGMRFWDALFGAAAMVYVFLMGRRLGGPLAGVSAALLLFAHRQLIFEHGLRTNNMEASVLLGYCGGMYHFLRWRDQAAARGARTHAVAACLFFVLGFMTKFVAALFLPAIWAMTLLASRAGRLQLRLDWRAWAVGAALTAALTLPWFIYQYARLGRQLVDTLLMSHVVTRFTSSLDTGHLKPWSFYLTSMTAGLLDAGIALLTAAGLIFLIARTLRGTAADGGPLLLWLTLPIVLISLGTSKLYHYAYPFLPPLALAGGLAVATVANVVPRVLGWVFGPAGSESDPLAVARTVIAGLVVVSLLPVTAVANNLRRVANDVHPVRAVRDCVREAGRNGRVGPGVWVEGNPSGWIYYYYMRKLGPWQQREQQSDATVLLNLFDPKSARPVLITNTRFDEVMRRLQTRDQPFVEYLARRAEMSPEAMEARLARPEDVGLMTLVHERLLLAGPYRACAPGRLRVPGLPR
jgi:4-amino-4-deoxy-L-arabinose transferase-like glycosyltransferase